MTFKSPRQRFRESPYAKDHGDLVSRAGVQYAFDTAMLQIVEDQGQAKDGTVAAMFRFRLEGAELMRKTFLRLVEPDLTPEQRSLDTLPHPNA